VFPSYAGLHVSGSLAKGFDVAELVRRAGEAGVGLYSTEPFYLGAPQPGLIFGYAACGIDDIQEGTRRLGALLRSMNAPRLERSKPS
jgi:DNA-binding transcriptional MocR family regulator